MLRYLLLLALITSSAFATDASFQTDEDRTLQAIKASQTVRAEIVKDSKKREVASTNSNIIDETGELDAYLANAESELDQN
ncbi:MAG: hypothetical protein HN576_07605 [Bacteriovoracaceae bacterium]|jgi:hypothetical protein|nr:hypothetical protein [Bacteriovoracaceae bacterium]